MGNPKIEEEAERIMQEVELLNGYIKKYKEDFWTDQLLVFLIFGLFVAVASFVTEFYPLFSLIYYYILVGCLWMEICFLTDYKKVMNISNDFLLSLLGILVVLCYMLGVILTLLTYETKFYSLNSCLSIVLCVCGSLIIFLPDIRDKLILRSIKKILRRKSS